MKLWWYIQGNIRYFLVKIGLGFLIRKKIKTIVDIKKEEASRCYFNGSCLECGCKTPHMFYTNKPCEKKPKPCYEVRNNLKI